MKFTAPLSRPASNKRPYSISIEDVFFGDSGKGSVVAKFNYILGKKRKIVSLRFNGGSNAGHETYISGKKVTTHQVPMGVVAENATAVITRGMVVNPQELIGEIETIKKQLGGKLPGKLNIDDRVVLSLDTHRSLESALNSFTTGGHGSTATGIAPTYAGWYLRIPVTLSDLLSEDWKDIFKKHYVLYEKLISGFGGKFKELSETDVFSTMEKAKSRKVGSLNVFLKRLEETRNEIRKYANSQVYELLSDSWKDKKVAITLEGAQGAGLDPYHGVYPDVTSSRPMSRFVNDATYNIILPEEIAVRAAVMKTTYMSSVGRRVLPGNQDGRVAIWIQEKFDEKGRTTGRLRDIYPISIPIAQYLKRAAGYDFIVATHIDAAKKDIPIKVVTHYNSKKSGKAAPYLPYQNYLDTLRANFIEFPSWNGEKVKDIKNISSLPREAKRYLNYLAKNIAPVIMATNGPDLGDCINSVSY